MAKELSKMLEKFSKNSEIFTEENDAMSNVADVGLAADLLEEIAQPLPPRRGQMFERMAARVARFSGYALTAGRAENIWRREARAIPTWEMTAFAKAKREAVREKARQDAQRLSQFFLLEASRLRSQDPEFYGPEIDRLERASSVLGEMAGPGRASGSAPAGVIREGGQ